MVMKKTIAIIGLEFPLASALAQQMSLINYPLLLINHNPIISEELCSAILSKNAQAQVEALSCEYEGCWEADIIILATDPLIQASVATKIKEVVTGKIVVSISSHKEVNNKLESLLPYSKIVEAIYSNISLNTSDKISLKEIKMLLYGKDAKALTEVSKLFKDVGILPVVVGLPY
jgi:predicted dinucleotide-binding enzyme